MTPELQNGGPVPENPSAAAKKSRESERRRRRRKQKKNKAVDASAGDESDTAVANGDDNAKENSDPQLAFEKVEVEYIPENVEPDGLLDEEFRKIFEKFKFTQVSETEENNKKDETATDTGAKNKADSDDEEEEQDAAQKEKGGTSNKKKKLQRRMKIAELKQICSRPDVVEVWDATSADPKLLVFLKSYRNTVPVPRHWCQKRKFLQASGCDNFWSLGM